MPISTLRLRLRPIAVTFLLTVDFLVFEHTSAEDTIDDKDRVQFKNAVSEVENKELENKQTT